MNHTDTLKHTPARLDPQLRAQIRELFLQYRANRSPELRSRLIEVNTPLVKHLAGRFKATAEPREDLVQVGMVGLIKAVDRFDPERGLEFSTFAVPTILGEIRRYFRDATWPVHVPRGARELHSSITTAMPELIQRLGRTPTTEEIADRLGTTEAAVVEAMDAGNNYTAKSLDAMSGQFGDVGEAAAGFDDERLAQVERIADLRPALADLPERQQEVLVQRFVHDKSQTQIAAALGVSQMQVSRLLSRSIQQLREYYERTAGARGAARAA